MTRKMMKHSYNLYKVDRLSILKTFSKNNSKSNLLFKFNYVIFNVNSKFFPKNP